MLHVIGFLIIVFAAMWAVVMVCFAIRPELFRDDPPPDPAPPAPPCPCHGVAYTCLYCEDVIPYWAPNLVCCVRCAATSRPGTCMRCREPATDPFPPGDRLCTSCLDFRRQYLS
jgi:hypothetical protein